MPAYNGRTHCPLPIFSTNFFIFFTPISKQYLGLIIRNDIETRKALIIDIQKKCIFAFLVIKRKKS